MDYTSLIQDVVEQVLKQLNPAIDSGNQSTEHRQFGIFKCVNQAVVAARKGQARLVQSGVNKRKEIISILKRTAKENAAQWGELELKETGVGRLDHKIEKLIVLENVPGVEMLQSVLHSGDFGISIDELAPWGVIGCVTPVTHSIPTITANAINMIASGNALVINPHPSAHRCASIAVETYNKLIFESTGIDNLICLITPPTLETANKIFEHEDIALLVITGGPIVARAALAQKKKSIVAGPGNPPVVVDETADLNRAAESIIMGAAFDNGLLCIGEKEVFVVNQVFDDLMLAIERSKKGKAFRLNPEQVSALTTKAFEWQEDHFVPIKEFVGQDCEVLANAIGLTLPKDQKYDLLFGETDEENPFVYVEQMMPFVPFVRVSNVETAVEKAVLYEHGYGHTAVIHSNNLATITKMGKRINTTIFVANGPSTCGLGLEGEGYPSFSIATPSGEGITNPLTFSRFRRMSICGSLSMV